MCLSDMTAHTNLSAHAGDLSHPGSSSLLAAPAFVPKVFTLQNCYLSGLTSFFTDETQSHWILDKHLVADAKKYLKKQIEKQLLFTEK